MALLQAGETGAMIFLSMNKGDTVDLTVNANYETTPSNNNFLGTAYSTLFNSFDAVYGSGVEGGVSSSSTVFEEALNGIDMSGKGNNSTSPRAFLNYIFFDHEMNYVRAGFLQITTAAQGIGVHQTISLNDIIADQEGYILAYLSNENAEEVAIHWDDFTVYHGKTNVVQAQAYYPYGGRFDQYQRTASTKNVFLYNEGAERLEDFSFNLDETKHRIYDPWGRLGWWQIDPYASRFYHLTPYNYAFLNPILYNDPLGDCPPDDPNCQGGMSRSEHAQRAFWNALPNAAAEGAIGVAMLSDVNDATVLATTITRGEDAVNITGSRATPIDKVAAIAGAVLPVVSGSAVKKGLNVLRKVLSKNKAQGKAFEKQVGNTLDGVKANQVTIEAADGTKTRVDFVQNDAGSITLTEAKSSVTAPLTKNQKIAHPQIEQSGGVVKGKKGEAVGLPAGTKIPPTKVKVVRPDDVNN